MKNNKINTNKLKISGFMYAIVLFLFVVFAISLTYRCMVDYEAVDGVTISEFINNRNIKEEVLLPERGTIYDRNGNALAQDVSSYTLIAYLSKTRTRDENNPKHVVDKEKTAKTLSKYINTSYDRILEILNKDAYQVEFGPGGKNLSQLEMEAIKKLELPGIDFIKSTKRYYPNGDFASYLLGYTVTKENEAGDSYMVGELGIEGYYNNELTGTNGYIKYEKDGRGNIIANSNEYREDAIDGDDIYLTIDKNIQLFVENAVGISQKESKAEWVVMAIMDAKSGEILGYSSTPSYDPNIRNLTNYLDPLVSYAYEPGSTMKTFSYMCAIDSGKYNGSDTYMSGSKTYVSQRDKNDTITIRDWNKVGWGRVSYDFGFAMSSNIAVANLLENVITKKELRTCYDKYGFGKKTGITLNNELSGDISFTYDVEAATAGYGQGITITPVQMLQAMSIIANDGTMIHPYVVNKIISSNGDIVLENKREEVSTVASKKTTDKIKTLLRSVIFSDRTNGTGYAYKMDGYDLIGKTGTASIFEDGKYLVDNGDYIYSFAGLYPGDDPEIVIYMVMKKPKDNGNYMAPRVKEVVINTSKYLNIDTSKKERSSVLLGDYSNKITTEISDMLKNKGINVITLGTGNKVINQYPNNGVTVYKGDLAVLLTNNYDKKMINFKGLSYKEVKGILDLMGVTYELSGYGYAYEQNIEVDKVIDKKVIIKFKGLY